MRSQPKKEIEKTVSHKGMTNFQKKKGRGGYKVGKKEEKEP